MRILLVDDHDLILKGLEKVLNTSFSGDVNVFSATTGKYALDLASVTTFDVAILDVELPDCKGTDLISQFKERNPNLKIIVNTMHNEVWYMRTFLDLNVDGIVVKSLDSTQVVNAVKEVMAGNKFYCKYAEKVAGMMKRSDEGPSESLTSRELDVLKYISEGMSTVEIAEELSLSANTVETHRRRIMEKLKAKNVADLIMIAISNEIIPLRKPTEI